jgi:hypothetical protein
LLQPGSGFEPLTCALRGIQAQALCPPAKGQVRPKRKQPELSAVDPPPCARPLRASIGTVSQAARAPDQSLVLDGADRVWLAERLREYRDLLAYLRDH